MKNLETMGVQEINQTELRIIEGGNSFWKLTGVGIVIAIVAEVIGDWDNLEAGFKGDPPVTKS